jgi:SAM-dependent methyltransferase
MTNDNIAQVARFWNDIAPDFDAIYTGKKSAFARYMDRVLRKDIFERYEWVMERAGEVSGQSVIDVGCGSGRFVTTLAQRGAHVTGLDIAPNMIDLSRQLVTRDGVADRCDFIVSDVLDWKTRDMFDLVIAIGFWDYIADPTDRLRVIRSMTRGRFLSAWPRFWTWRMPIRKVRLGIAGCPVYFFRAPQIRALLEKTGFRIESWKVVGKLYCVDAVPV